MMVEESGIGSEEARGMVDGRACLWTRQRNCSPRLTCARILQKVQLPRSSFRHKPRL